MKAKRKSDGAIIEVESIDTCYVVDAIPFALYYIDEEQTIYDETELDLIFPLSEPEEEVTIEGYIARDEDGALSLFPIKPFRDYADINDVCRGFWDSITDYSIIIPKGRFPHLAWSDEPLEVTITIKPKKKCGEDLIEKK